QTRRAGRTGHRHADFKVALLRGDLEAEQEEDQQLKHDVDHRRHRNVDLFRWPRRAVPNFHDSSSCLARRAKFSKPFSWHFWITSWTTPVFASASARRMTVASSGF